MKDNDKGRFVLQNIMDRNKEQNYNKFYIYEVKTKSSDRKLIIIDKKSGFRFYDSLPRVHDIEVIIILNSIY